VPQLIIFSAFIGNQGSVCALLDNSTFVEYGDFIAELAGG
jgi:hypothetical protein